MKEDKSSEDIQATKSEEVAPGIKEEKIQEVSKCPEDIQNYRKTIGKALQEAFLFHKFNWIEEMFEEADQKKEIEYFRTEIIHLIHEGIINNKLHGVLEILLMAEGKMKYYTSLTNSERKSLGESLQKVFEDYLKKDWIQDLFKILQIATCLDLKLTIPVGSGKKFIKAVENYFKYNRITKVMDKTDNSTGNILRALLYDLKNGPPPGEILNIAVEALSYRRNHGDKGNADKLAEHLTSR